MSRRKFSTHIKSLVHFDYPYFNEPNDGCRDEIAGNVWSRMGNAKFVGTEIPNDAIVEGTPKFGYRCLQTAGNSDYITRRITDTLSTYEIECFVRITNSGVTGNIFKTMCSENSSITISKDADNKIVFTHNDPDNTKSLTSAKALTINTWHHVKCRVSGQTVSIYIDGQESGAQDFTGLEPQDLSAVNIGGITGQIDEFVLRDALSENTVPSEPYQGILDLSLCGGYGNGNTSITAEANALINSYAMITAVSGAKLTIGAVSQGKYASFSAGSEIMLHVSKTKNTPEDMLGYYAFRKILNVSGNVLTIDSAVSSEFNLTGAVQDYYVQAIAIPNVKNFTVPAGVICNAKVFDTSTGGGIIAIRASENVTINGWLHTFYTGPIREDKLQMTHADLIDRFILGYSGGIYILCGGTFTSTSDARLGCSWSGLSVPVGIQSSGVGGVCGGAGYGGAGGISVAGGEPGRGGVGGGGGAGTGERGGDAGSPGASGQFRGAAGTGGGGASNANGATAGGTAGVMLSSPSTGTGCTGGAGAGGCSGQGNDGNRSTSGANVIIIAKKLKAAPESISTGGGGGHRKDSASGGGGTGFAYIACEEMI